MNNHSNDDQTLNIINISKNNDILLDLNNLDDGRNEGISELNNKIDIFIHKRNNRKCITTVKGLDKYPNFDIKKFVKIIKKKFCCIGSYNKDEFSVNFSGDQRDNVIEYLKYVGINKESINKHGF